MVYEGQRKDYSSSDHAPGTKVASQDVSAGNAKVVRLPGTTNTGAYAHTSNVKSMSDPESADFSNVVPEVVLDMARKNKGQ